jgi:RNA polymerase sigma-70 factor (ECF subfamily)
VTESSRPPDVVTPDSDLLRGAIEGDDTAFAEFCLRSLPTLLRYLTHECRVLDLSNALAEDAAQEAFLRAVAWTRAHPGADPLSLGWLIRVGQNALRDWARRGRRAVGGEDLSHVAAPPDPDPGPDDDLWRALERLAPDDRAVLELVYVEELPVPEVADRLGVSVDAAYKRHQRALDRLHNLMT